MCLKIFLRMNSLLYKTSKNKDLIFQKPDIGNSAVIVARQNYLKKMVNILSDQKKLIRVNLKDDTLLNFTVNQENHVGKLLKKLVESNSMTEKTGNC